MIQRFFLLLACSALILTTSCSDDDDKVQEYSVTVTAGDNGTAAANVQKAVEGATVTLTATPAEGYQFSKWTVAKGGVTLNPNETTASATFTMPAGDVEVSAAFSPVSANPVYSVTVKETPDYITVTVSPEEAEEGETITVSFVANPPSGMNVTFHGWLVVKGDVTFEDEKAETTTFKMPAEDVELEVSYTAMTDGPQP